MRNSHTSLIIVRRLAGIAYGLCLVFVVGSFAACATNAPSSTHEADCSVLTRENADDCIRLNEIQVLGTHNSYKLDVHPDLVDALDAHAPGWSTDIAYGHRTLTEQLSELGIRKFELDVFADPEGGRYAEPAGAVLAGDDAFLNLAEMQAPGLKVLHVQDIDYRSHCTTLVSCLREIRDWSAENPRHLPIMVMIEMKDSEPQNGRPISITRPVPIDSDNIHRVDDEIWSVFERGHVITPDVVRGDFETLEEAILVRGWPTLAESRGRVLFALDNTGSHRDAYLDGSPDLEGRALFVSTHPGEPTAGFIKMNDAVNDADTIRDYVGQGYLIRTRSDIPTHEARSGDTARRERALTSGAQYVSTDYPEPSPFGSGYVVTLPGAVGPGRCNPVSAPAGCDHAWIVE